MVADRIMDLATGIGFEQAKENLLPYFCSFLKDLEPEVRTAAAGRMSDFCRILDDQSIL
jgi:serine/threonine-protein phosphatase 2A regulatory subunit A